MQCRFVLVGDYPVENGVLYGTFERANLGTRCQVEDVHYLLTVYRWLEIAYAVLLFNVLEFLAYNLEIVEELLFAHLVL